MDDVPLKEIKTPKVLRGMNRKEHRRGIQEIAAEMGRSDAVQRKHRVQAIIKNGDGPTRRHDPGQLSSMVARLYCEGYEQAEIARELQVAPATISITLDRIRSEWRAHAIIDMHEAIGRELAKLDTLERTYWNAWRRSQRQKVRTRTESRQGQTTTRIAGVTKEDSVGDPRFLEGIERIIAKRVEMLGLSAPRRIAVTTEEGTADAGYVPIGDARRLDLLLGALAGAAVASAGVVIDGTATGDRSLHPGAGMESVAGYALSEGDAGGVRPAP